MNTHPTDEQLSAFNDAQLDGTALRRVAAHMEQCETCRQSARALREVRERLHSLPAPPPPAPDFWTNAQRQMRVEGRAAAAPARVFTLGRRWAAGIAVGAALGFAAFLPFAAQAPAPTSGLPAASADLSADMVDVSALVQAHAQSAGRQPLADADRQTLLAADGDTFLADADAAP